MQLMDDLTSAHAKRLSSVQARAEEQEQRRAAAMQEDYDRSLDTGNC